MMRIQHEKETKRKRAYKRLLKKQLYLQLFVSLTITMTVLCVYSLYTTKENKDKVIENVESSNQIAIEYKEEFVNIQSEEENTETEYVEVEEEHTESMYSDVFSEEEIYMLAKIAMAEAEGEDKVAKLLVMATVLNRVNSDKFPNTIEEVLFQKCEYGNRTVYQFSPVMPGGRWYTTEPNAECWEAVDMLINGLIEGHDMSYEGILYFESVNNESDWHRKSLEFVFKRGNIRFYK